MSISISTCYDTCSGCCINNECVSDIDCIILFFSSSAILMTNLVILVCCSCGIFVKGFYDVIKLMIIKIVHKIKRDNYPSLENIKKDRNNEEIKFEYMIAPNMAVN